MDVTREPEASGGPAPLRILWYWPHPHRGDSALATGIMRPGDSLTVECLATYRGEVLGSPDEGDAKVRDLPDVAHGAMNPARRVANRLTVHATRAWRRRRLALSGRFDVLHVQNVGLLDGLTLRGLARTVPVVLVVHDVELHKQVVPHRLQHLLLAQAYRQATRLVVYHEHIKQQLVMLYGVNADRVDVVPHPLAARHEPNEHREGPPLRLLLFGSLRANKGIDVLLEAVRSLSPVDVSVVVAGAGDADIEERLRAAAAELPHLRLELGYQSDASKARLFREADIVVLPYVESFLSQSGVLFDGYAFGVPALASDVGALGATVRADGTGWVVPPGDSVALAAKIGELTAQPHLRKEAAGRIQDVLDRRQDPAIAGALRDVYVRSLATRR